MLKINVCSSLLCVSFLICGLIIWPAYLHKGGGIFGKVSSSNSTANMGLASDSVVESNNDDPLFNTYYYHTYTSVAPHITFVSCLQKTLADFATNECIGSTPPPVPDAGSSAKSAEPTCEDLKNQKMNIKKAIEELVQKAAQIPKPNIDVEMVVSLIIELKRELGNIEKTAREADSIFGPGAGDMTLLGNPEYIETKKQLDYYQKLLHEAQNYDKKIKPFLKQIEKLQKQEDAIRAKMADKRCRYLDIMS